MAQLSENSRILQCIAQRMSDDSEPKSDPVTEDKTETDPEQSKALILSRRVAGRGDEMVVRKRYPHYRETTCASWCSCRCHLPSKFQSPECFASVIGNLLVSYKGIRTRPKVCNDKRCRRQSEPRFEATYRFPTWLFRRMFYLAVSIRGSVGPELTLKSMRMVAPSSPVFSYAVQGNLEKIQDLFSRGLASPYDVASNNGRTPLHVSLRARHDQSMKSQ